MVIQFGFLFGLFIIYIVTAETARPPKNKGDVLVFPAGKAPKQGKQLSDLEINHNRRPEQVVTNNELQDDFRQLTAGNAIFHWEDVCYDIKLKSEERRLLDHVDGWVKPGTSTALMVRGLVYLRE